MWGKEKVFGTACVLAAILMFWQFHGSPPSMETLLEGVGAPKTLEEHSQEFERKRVIKVTAGVYVAVNYAIANSIMVEGKDGIIIIDTTESPVTAAEIFAEFRKITDKPVEGIIYTHHHADHVYGTQSFLEGASSLPQIWAHSLFGQATEKVKRTGPLHYRRAIFQFGTLLDKYRLNAGIGPKLHVNMSAVRPYSPTHIVDGDEKRVQIAGIDLVLIHLPGETDDQMGVWYPEKRVLFAADNVYKTFPNLYAIRGTAPRNVLDWATSCERMRELRAEFLVPSHCSPLQGAEQIHDVLTAYRNGIRFVHDQTLRYLNQGLHPEEIAQLVKLPPRLHNHRFLRQHYGTVPWSVKAVYEMYLGWFSGDPVDLHPLTPRSRAEKMVSMVGEAKLLSQAQKALSEGDHQWALELASHLHKLDRSNAKAKDIRREAMKALAALSESANGRNYYLTAILEDNDMIPRSNIKQLAAVMPMETIFQAFKTRLKAEQAIGVDKVAVFSFTDTEETFTVHICDCIVDVFPHALPKWDILLTTTTPVWRELMANTRSPVMAYMKGDIVLEGGLQEMGYFMSYFDRSEAIANDIASSKL